MTIVKSEILATTVRADQQKSRGILVYLGGSVEGDDLFRAP